MKILLLVAVLLGANYLYVEHVNKKAKAELVELRKQDSRNTNEIETLKSELTRLESVSKQQERMPDVESIKSMINENRVIVQEAQESVKKTEDFVLKKMLPIEEQVEINKKDIAELKGEKKEDDIKVELPEPVKDSLTKVPAKDDKALPKKLAKKSETEIKCYDRIDVLSCRKKLKDSFQERCYKVEKTDDMDVQTTIVSDYLQLKEEVVETVVSLKTHSEIKRISADLCNGYLIDTHCASLYCFN